MAPALDLMHPMRSRSLATVTFGALLRTGAACLGLAAAAAAQSPPPAPAIPSPTTHWAFRPVQRPPVPTTAPGTTPFANAIDAFVATRLAHDHLQPSQQADRVTLIRRLWLVVLGMPPTPDDVDAFVADAAPLAFERLVDRALADPRYGERWARHWLDVVRFAETNGFETNRERPAAWRFRDYVITAFNDDLPYDRFVKEQLAGDALGNDIATGFLVGGPVDIVGSPDPVLTAQQRADELDDMVSTTGTAFLGLTIGCARCHTHKFDPIAHREYYAMAAMFAGVKHGERALPMPAAQVLELTELDARIQTLEQQLAPFVVAPVVTAAANAPGALRPPVDFARNEERLAPVDARFVRFTVLATSGAEPCLDELEVWAGDRNVALAENGAKATASSTLPGYAIHQIAHVHDGRVGNEHSWIANEVGGGWVQLEFAKAERIDRIVWGRDRLGRCRDRLPTSYRIEAAIESGAWQLVASSEDRQPFADAIQAPPGPVYRFDDVPPAAAAQGRQWLAELQQVQQQHKAKAEPPMAYAGTFVEPGPTFRMHRGDPMQPREAVAPATLELFAPITLPPDAPERQRRLRLAEWIASADHPLTARVLVNRVWQHHFGTGLVSTPSDFGKNGARPSHPDLLDWLASEFTAGGFRIKALQRQILTSATWRQASAPREPALAVDADDRLLWRFPPRRLEAEAIRDSMLAVSGALDPSRGGPGFSLFDVDRENVYHYHQKEDFGPAEARRMVYALKVRMEQDAVFGAFDCPDGSLVMPARSVSTTPLQALNLWNSRFVLQQSSRLADRVRAAAGLDAETQVRAAWRFVLQRLPTSDEAADAAALVATCGPPALCRALLNANEFLFLP